MIGMAKFNSILTILRNLKINRFSNRRQILNDEFHTEKDIWLDSLSISALRPLSTVEREMAHPNVLNKVNVDQFTCVH